MCARTFLFIFCAWSKYIIREMITGYRSRKKLNKKKSEHRHAMKRFLERGLVQFSKNLNDIFISQIKSNKATFVRRSSIRVTVWDITYNDKIYRCVYDKFRKQIVTLLKVSSVPVTQNPAQPEIQPKPVQPISNLSSAPIEKYGILWKSVKQLERYEKHLNKRYEKDYEKWIAEEKEKEGQSRLEAYEMLVKESKQQEDMDFL